MKEMQQALVTLEVVKAEKTINDYFSVGSIVKVPVELAETQCIKIVADQRHARSDISRWEMLAVQYDEETGRSIGQAFAVTEKELLKWERAMG